MIRWVKFSEGYLFLRLLKLRNRKSIKTQRRENKIAV